MRRQLPQARIEILEFSRLPAPEGELEFPLSGLRPTPAGGFWSGFVRYSGSRRFLVWAKVKVRITAPRVIAAQDLKPGHALEAAQLRLEMRDEFPAAGGFAGSLEEAAGRVPRRFIPSGAALRTGWLEAPREIARGDAVRVEVRSGGARVELEARAEAAGSTGDTITVRNPVSNRRFPARVEGKGKVSVGKGNP
jgi:flagella basal body P-ring formation protein FlgA